MADDNPPSISRILLFLTVLVFVGLKLQMMQVESGHCVPNWTPGADADCYLFDDDRLNAALAFAAAASSAGALVWLRRRRQADRRVQRLLEGLTVLSVLIGVWVLFTR